MSSLEQKKQELQELIKKRDFIGNELSELQDVLKVAGVTMEESLTDKEGFPRSDIDIVSIRTTRRMIQRLRNDYKDLTNIIGTKLEELHALAKENPQPETHHTPTAAATITTDNDQPFAVVNAVAPGSPAESAGLRRNDQILKFGGVNIHNHRRLQGLNEVVSQNENRPVPVIVSRGNTVLTLTLTPTFGWGGRGTLGCHILPL
ncbi:hypothetical protein BDB01DRAFT_833915 [Pilobolus umbonatus]|nr:hypothetical protein BDB01DRAFT_833915 [Pilobolus umbonatus]